jgi:uncharacterized protein (DUF58 family)
VLKNLELVRYIKQIEIHTKRLVNNMMMGNARSALKGSGFEFDQIREYYVGDDVRSIDWNSSARMDKILVKQYLQERSRTVMLLVDVSASSFYGSRDRIKYDTCAQIAAALALVADYAKDSVGLVLFTDQVEQYIPPRKGRMHRNYLINLLFTCTPKGKGTDIGAALASVARLKKKNMAIFLLSDCIDNNFEKPLKHIATRNDVIVVQSVDAHEYALPAVGLVAMQDIETGTLGLFDLRKRAVQKKNELLRLRQQEQDTLFKRCGIATLKIVVGKGYISTLVQFFKRRMSSSYE